MKNEDLNFALLLKIVTGNHFDCLYYIQYAEKITTKSFVNWVKTVRLV